MNERGELGSDHNVSNANKHDIKRQMHDLGEALSQEKGTIALLVGAGCPVAIRMDDDSTNKPLIPDVVGLTRLIEESLGADPSFETLLKHFDEDSVSEPNVEHMLTHVRNLKRVAGAGNVRGLDATALADLESSICSQVFEATNKRLPERDTAYHRVACWVGSVQRNSPITIFTTNYDLLMEQALEEQEAAFFDGFSGANRPFFDLRAMEEDQLPNRWTRLWKLHGSVNWRLVENGQRTVVRAMTPEDSEGTLLIHPSEFKYDQSRRMPYLAMFDRLRAFLRQPGAILVTCGYSFADEHVNENLLEGLAANPSAAVFGLLFNDLESERSAVALTQRLPRNFSLLARDRAVIRGVTAEWWDPGQEGDDAEAQPATFALGDFAKFGAFLAELAAAHPSSRHGSNHA